MEALRDRVRRGEWWTIALTAALVVLAGLQWNQQREDATNVRALAESDQRAWITAARVDGQARVGYPVVPTVVVVNTGKTPAWNVEVSYDYFVVDGGAKPPYPPADADYKSRGEVQSRHVLAPGSELKARVTLMRPDGTGPLLPTQDVLDAWTTGKQSVY